MAQIKPAPTRTESPELCSSLTRPWLAARFCAHNANVKGFPNQIMGYSDEEIAGAMESDDARL